MADLVGPEIFGEDYLWFMDPLLEARSDAEVELILRLLDLPAGSEVLDAPCGHGRIANRVSALGYRVLGLDSSRSFLDLARERAASSAGSVEYVEGDLRSMPFEGRFDAAVNWFSSFGYFDDEGNRAVLEGFRRALKPGGKLLIEQANRELLIANLPPSGHAVWLSERGDDLLVDKVTYDAPAGRSNTERIVVRDGEVRRFQFSLAQATASELTRMLHEAGFAKVQVLDENGDAFTVRSRRMLMLAR